MVVLSKFKSSTASSTTQQLLVQLPRVEMDPFRVEELRFPRDSTKEYYLVHDFHIMLALR